MAGTVLALTPLLISIHALREEGDSSDINLPSGIALFLSTPSARRATSRSLLYDLHKLYFYPRPPRGGRPKLPEFWEKDIPFLSTPSARRATRLPCSDDPGAQISIHALREEGDSKNRDKISIFKQIIQHSARI